VNLFVNGKKITTSASLTMRLVDFLRENLELTGTKEGCGEGECGACSVIIDGELINSCLVILGQVQNKSIITIEGLDEPEISAAFEETGAVQCGFCTPGMIIASSVLLAKNPSPEENEIKKAISGNLCRCTGYTKIIEAIKKAGKEKQCGTSN